jgi:hypothetical protein
MGDVDRIDLSAGASSSPACGQDQQLGDHRREPVHLAQAGLELLARVGIGRGRQRLLQPQPQAGQRGAELVRGIGDELALGLHEPLDARASCR